MIKERGFSPVLLLVGFAFIFVIVLIGIALLFYNSGADSEKKNTVTSMAQKTNREKNENFSSEQDGSVRSAPQTGNISSLTLLDIAGSKPLDTENNNFPGWVEYRDEGLNFSFYYPANFVKGDYGIIQSTKDFNDVKFIGVRVESIRVYPGTLKELVEKGELSGKIDENIVPNEIVSYDPIENVGSSNQPFFYYDIYLQNTESQVFLLRFESHSPDGKNLMDQMIKTITIINKYKVPSGE